MKNQRIMRQNILCELDRKCFMLVKDYLRIRYEYDQDRLPLHYWIYLIY